MSVFYVNPDHTPVLPERNRMAGDKSGGAAASGRPSSSHSRHSRYDADKFVIKPSFMLKRSQMKRWFTKANYKNRWFLLHAEYLTYHEGTTETGWLAQKGKIPLRDITMVEVVDDDSLGMINTFQVEYTEGTDKEKHILYIIANYGTERDLWIDALKTACYKLGGKFARQFHPGAWTSKLGHFTCCNQISRHSKGCKGYSSMYASYEEETTASSTGSEGSATGSLERVGSSKSVACVALYNYDRAESGDLNLRKGSEYSILDDRFQHWWRVKSKTGEIGFIPANYVKRVTQDGFENYGWYFPEITRHKCEHLLHDNGWDGCFLMRFSSRPGAYTLSVFSKDKEAPPDGIVRHYQVNKDDADKYYFTEHHKFSSIPDLISYHKYNLIGLATRLRGPPAQEDTQKHDEQTFLKQSKWHIDHDSLDFREEIGAGEFGAVYKGIWRGSLTVAIKSMKNDSMSKDDFLLEAETMMHLSHPNLVKLYGVSTTESDLYIVAEFMSKGALLNYLVNHRKQLMDSPATLIRMCTHVCRGMAYLEEQGFIHRDVAARNCLVGDRDTIKIGDFGLARFVLDQEYLSRPRAKIPIRWTAPEVLDTCKHSSKSDVWSYGVLLWEIYSGGKPPYGRQRKNVDVYNFVVLEQGRLEHPQACPAHVFNIMYSCWQQLPDDRPSFVALLSQLEQSKDHR